MILRTEDKMPCRVFDANGVELKYAVWADTETGEAVHLTGEIGGFVFSVRDDGQPGVATEWRQHPAPLRFYAIVDPIPAPPEMK